MASVRGAARQVCFRSACLRPRAVGRQMHWADRQCPLPRKNGLLLPNPQRDPRSGAQLRRPDPDVLLYRDERIKIFKDVGIVRLRRAPKRAQGLKARGTADIGAILAFMQFLAAETCTLESIARPSSRRSGGVSAARAGPVGTGSGALWSMPSSLRVSCTRRWSAAIEPVKSSRCRLNGPSPSRLINHALAAIFPKPERISWCEYYHWVGAQYVPWGRLEHA
jgi:hypothetical protein